jgi:hypothetical protein
MVKLYEVNGLNSGTHTLTATVAAKDPASSGNIVNIDLFQSLVGSVATDGSGSTGLFTDNFSDGSVSDWRVRSGAAWTVAADNPAGEPIAASQYAYANSGTATFNFLQTPSASGFSAAVTPAQSVRMASGFEYFSSAPSARLEYYILSTNSNWTSTTATDTGYGISISGVANAQISIFKRVPTTATLLATSSGTFNLSANTYYTAELLIESGGNITANLYDAAGGLIATASAVDTTYTSFASGLLHIRNASTTNGWRVSDFGVETIP